jgi:hypothetical protein
MIFEQDWYLVNKVFKIESKVSFNFFRLRYLDDRVENTF